MILICLKANSQNYTFENRDLIGKFVLFVEDSIINIDFIIHNKLETDIYINSVDNVLITCEYHQKFMDAFGIQYGVFGSGAYSNYIEFTPKLIILHAHDSISFDANFKCLNISEKDNFLIYFDYLNIYKLDKRTMKEISNSIILYPSNKLSNRKTYTLEREIYGRYCDWVELTYPTITD